MSDLYFFNFRQTKPSPVSHWIVCGPYETYEKAKSDWDSGKAPDFEFSEVYAARSKEDALKILDGK